MKLKYDMLAEELQDDFTMDFQFNGTAILNVDTDLAQNINVEVWISFKIKTNTIGQCGYDTELLNERASEHLQNLSLDDIPFLDEYIIHTPYNKYEGQGTIVKVNKTVYAGNVSMV